MNSEIKILKFLLSNKEQSFTIKRIAEKTNINYRIAYEKTIQFQKEGLIEIKKVGNSNLCQLTNNFNNKIFWAEYERRRDLFKNKDFLVLYNRLSKLTFSFIALLFGSQSKGTANKQSDIDLLTIEGDEKEITAILSLWPEKIHLTAITYKDFKQMAISKEFTVVSEAIKNNIILIGIEEYYRLLSNAK